ncbi:hypothetical protein O3G_MSEX010191 [Manduca sexta]|uniref:Uncharacterized protein n=1 Tax=Manduca sexta TaxID=7130 RepID=A0A921ZHU4_MANSE|nr:hypothetical protein O3G_MSEX010191 [Manduca sexta]
MSMYLQPRFAPQSSIINYEWSSAVEYQPILCNSSCWIVFLLFIISLTASACASCAFEPRSRVCTSGTCTTRELYLHIVVTWTTFGR